jgi:hypothetical protein
VTAETWRDYRDQMTPQDLADLDYLATFQNANPAYLLDEARKRAARKRNGLADHARRGG